MVDLTKIPEDVLANIDSVMSGEGSTEVAPAPAPFVQAITSGKSGVFQGRSTDAAQQRAAQAPAGPGRFGRPRERELAAEAREEIGGDETDPELTPSKPARKAAELADEVIDETDEAQTQAGADEPGDLPPLDPGLRWALTQKGMKPGHIDAIYEKDPLGSMDFFNRIVAAPAPEAKPATPAIDPEIAKQVAEFKKDPAAFEKENGKSATAMFKYMMGRMEADEAAKQEEQKVWAFGERDRVVATLDERVYGTEADKVDAKQAAARHRLYLKCDDIRAGSRANGRPMSIEQGLKEANAVLNPSGKRAVIKAVQRRARTITLRPGGRQTAEPKGGRLEGAMAAYTQRYAELTGEEPD